MVPLVPVVPWLPVVPLVPVVPWLPVVPLVPVVPFEAGVVVPIEERKDSHATRSAWASRRKISPGRPVVPVVTPSAQAMIESVTSSGALPSVVLITLMTIAPTLSAGNSSFGSAVGAPVTLTTLSPDSDVNVTSIWAMLLDGTLISRMIAPPFGISITKVGFFSVKSTPFLIRSSLFGISLGVVRTEFVATRVLMYSISSQVFRVVPLVPVVP